MNENTNNQIIEFRVVLERRLAELHQIDAASRDSRKPVVLDQSSVGRLSRMDAMQGQQMAAENARRRNSEMQRIKAALGRIENDEFGYCLNCDENISDKRLQFDPSTQLCVKCATVPTTHE